MHDAVAVGEVCWARLSEVLRNNIAPNHVDFSASISLSAGLSAIVIDSHFATSPDGLNQIPARNSMSDKPFIYDPRSAQREFVTLSAHTFRAIGESDDLHASARHFSQDIGVFF